MCLNTIFNIHFYKKISNIPVTLPRRPTERRDEFKHHFQHKPRIYKWFSKIPIILPRRPTERRDRQSESSSAIFFAPVSPRWLPIFIIIKMLFFLLQCLRGGYLLGVIIIIKMWFFLLQCLRRGYRIDRGSLAQCTGGARVRGQPPRRRGTYFYTDSGFPD